MKNFFIFIMLLSGLLPQLHATILFDEDFSSSTIDQTKPNGYVGGWFGSNVPFEQWVSGTHGSITAGDTLAITNTATDRSAAIVFDPGFFAGTGPGDYTVTYDISTYSGGPSDLATVGVWSGEGYDLSGATGNALLVDTLSNSLVGVGTATTSLVGSDSQSTTGTGFSIDFTYDGTSAIALFFGSDNNLGFPFPAVEFDNVQLMVVPEQESLVLSGILLGAIGMYGAFRRRNYNRKRK